MRRTAAALLVTLGGDEADPVSDVTLLRYLPDGRPDPAFGAGGRIVAGNTAACGRFELRPAVVTARYLP